jgi:hypothetical protein
MLRSAAVAAVVLAGGLGATVLGGPASAGTPGVATAGVTGGAAVWDFWAREALPPGWDDGVSALATGPAGSVAIKDGHILASGSGIEQVPYAGRDVTAVGVGETFAVALHGGAVTVWGQNPHPYYPELTVPQVLTVPPEAQQPGAITAISVGYQHILALTTDGHVLAWGSNGNLESKVPPQFSAGSSVRVTSITAAQEISFAVDSSGAVTVWGGAVGTNVHNWTVVPSAVASHVVSVAVNAEVAAALRDDGTVVALPDYGYYWNGATFPVPAAAASGIVAIASGGADPSGNNAALAVLRRDGTVIRWNFEGEVPDPLAPPFGKRVVALAPSLGIRFGEIQASTPAGSAPVSASINGTPECATAWPAGRPVTMLPCVTDPTNPDWASQQFFPRYINPYANGDFRIYNWLYDSCLTPTGLANGASLTLAPCTGAANQAWFKIQLANGKVVVTNRAAVLSIDTANGSTLAGATLVIRTSTGTPTQTWTVNPAWSGI